MADYANIIKQAEAASAKKAKGEKADKAPSVVIDADYVGEATGRQCAVKVNKGAVSIDTAITPGGFNESGNIKAGSFSATIGDLYVQGSITRILPKAMRRPSKGSKATE